MRKGYPGLIWLAGRRWIIPQGGNREGVLRAVSSGAGLWGFEGLQRGV